jgi:NADPH-dependent F420 reductase
MAKDVPVVAVVGGTGALGRGIALRLGRAGYRVIIGTRDVAKGAQTAGDLNAALGAAVVECADNIDAAERAGIVVLTVPYAAQRPTVESLRSALDGKILIDTTVPLQPPRVSVVQLPPEGSAVAAIQRLLGDKVRVVSALQNVAANKLQQLGVDIDCDVLVCADDAAARKFALEMIARMGLRGLDAGPISNSAAAEALTSVLIFLNRKYKVAGSAIRITGLNDAAAAS